jgi:hypothetical protein
MLNMLALSCDEDTETKGERAMAENWTEERQTQVAIDIINVFQRACLTATEARSLIEKVRMLIDAEELGFFQQSH